MGKNYRLIFVHILSSLILLFSLSLFFFNHFTNFIRLFYSLKYFFIDAFNYFVSLFSKRSFEYNRIYHFLKDLDDGFKLPFPEEFGNLWIRIQVFFRLIVNKWNLESRVFGSVTYLIVLMQSLYFIFLLTIPLKILFNSQFAINELSFTDESKPLRFANWMKERVFLPVFNFVKSVFVTLIQKRLYFIPLVVIYGIYLNVFAIILDAFAFLFYFSSSFKVVAIYQFAYTTIYSLWPTLSRIPLPLYLLGAFYIFKLWQKKVGIDRLYHLDAKNKGFAKSLGVVISVVAPPRAGKTTFLNSLGQDYDEIFRTDFLDIIETQSAYFPDFPFNELESFIDKKREDNSIPNRYVIKDVIAKLFWDYEETGVFKFTYDLKAEIRHVSAGNKIIFLEDALITYAEAYYYYSYDGALVSANFSNRFDSILLRQNDKFPLWNYFPLVINPYDSLDLTHFSKNINFDSFRIFKKVGKTATKDLPLTDIGVYLEMEASKQWGNQHDNKEFKKTDETANPLNDGFSMFLSSFAHASLIDYQPFIRYVMDYQRVGDLGAKFGGMAETRVTIIPLKEDPKITLPLFIVAPVIYGFLINLRKKLYTRKYRHYRSDRTFLFNLINKVGSWATRRMSVITNSYCYIEDHVTTTAGNDDSGIDMLAKKKYYKLFKKHYSDRFRSDALRVIYEDASRPGLLAFKDFTDLDMSAEDLQYQNSYAYVNRLQVVTKAATTDEDSVGPLW